MDSPLLRIDRLELENYRRFRSLSVDFHPRLTVLAARNGLGKTAVLDAVTVALGPFVGAFDEARGAHFGPPDVRRQLIQSEGLDRMEPQFPVRLRACGFVDGEFGKLERELRKLDGHTTYGSARYLKAFAHKLRENVERLADSQDHPTLLFPLVAYYGTARLWGEMRLTKSRKHRPSASRASGYVDALSAASRYKTFADWIERLCRAEFEERNNPVTLAAVQDSLGAIREALDTVLESTGWHSVVYRTAQEGVAAQHADFGVLPVDFLSDGIRNMIGLAGDIAHRAMRLNPHLGRNAVKETPGIVLIDEVDQHLHPEWQQVVVPALLKAFPKVQFIVTTHSPQVISTVAKESVRIARELGPDEWQFVEPEHQTRGVESAEVLARIMGVDPVPRVEEARWLAEYRTLVESGEAETAQAGVLRERIVGHFGKDHPAVLDCDRLARFLAFKRKVAENGGT